MGRPFLYGTTSRFLEVFGLTDLSSLPSIEEIKQLKEADFPLFEQDAQ
jgi:segregation and condensation protein B